MSIFFPPVVESNQLDVVDFITEVAPQGAASPLTFSTGKNHEQKTGFKQITFSDLCQLASKPSDLSGYGDIKTAKANAQWLLPSDCAVKTKAEVMKHDSYSLLIADIDSHDLALTDVVDLLTNNGLSQFLVYSTVSAMPGNLRWRVVATLADAICHAQWLELQTGLSVLLGGDECAERANQISYMPAKSIKNINCYDHHINEGQALDAEQQGVFVDYCSEIKAQLDEIAQASQEVKAKPRSTNTTTSSRGSLIDDVNDNENIHSLLSSYGYKKQGLKYLAPESGSGVAGVIVYKDKKDGKTRVYSNHATDPLSGCGRDCFDVICTIEYNGDEGRAIEELLKIEPYKSLNVQRKKDFAIANNQETPEQKKQRQKEYAIAKQAEQDAKDRAEADAMMQNADAAMASYMAEKAANEESSIDAYKKESALKKEKSRKFWMLGDKDLSTIDITKPHGVLGEMCDIMKKMAYRRLDMSYPIYGLQTLASLAGKRKGINGQKLSLITFLIAESATGKDIGQRFLMEVNRIKGKTTYGQPRSDKEIIRALFEANGEYTYCMDECHSFFAGVNNKNAPAYLQGISSMILSTATASTVPVDFNYMASIQDSLAKRKASLNTIIDKISSNDIKDPTGSKKATAEEKILEIENQEKWLFDGIPNPIINLAGASTPRKFDSIVNPDTLEDGMMGRCLLLRSDEINKEIRPTLFDIPEHFTNFRLGNILLKCQKAIDAGEQINVDAEAEVILNQLLDKFNEEGMNEDPIMGACYRRANYLINRIAPLLALDSGTVTKEDLYYATAIVLHNFECKISLAKKNASQTNKDNQSSNDYIEDVITRKVESGKPVYISKLRFNDKITTLIREAKDNNQPSIVDTTIQKMLNAGIITLSSNGKTITKA